MDPQTFMPAWLENAVFYQIYPQSFADSNGDGIGDIPGIINKLDYLERLGVNALWINPCFVSPFQDAGYDVADYYTVAPRYGTNDDLRRLFQAASQRGIRVLLDLVPGHTSLEHPWFKQSCLAQSNTYSDWYIWTNSAWEWDVPGFRAVSGHAQRDASYITNFFYFQPALNYGFAHPDPGRPWQQPTSAPGPQAVRREIRNIMRFWLEMGAGGFRVDLAGSLVKNDPGGNATAAFWREIRHWLDAEYPQAALVSEWGQPKTAIPAGFHMDFCIPFGMPGYLSLWRKADGPGPGSDPYGASFFDPAGRGSICEFLDNYLAHYSQIQGQGHIALPTGNHDTGPRISKNRSSADLELIFLFLLTMPGAPFIYYGDEIGLRNIEGLPSKEGAYDRTRLRTPMQWDASPNAGFSTASPTSLYLPVDPAADRPTVAAQLADPGSLLHRVRRLITVRKAHPALSASAGFEPVFAQPGQYPLVYRRWSADEHLLIAINPAAHPSSARLPSGLCAADEPLYGSLPQINSLESGYEIHLAPVSGCILKIPG